MDFNSAIDRLRAHVHGDVLRPDDPNYDDARAGFQLLAVHRPEVLVRATETDDVIAALEFAERHGLRVRVQATGHGLTTAATDGLLIDTSALSQVSVDPAARTARIGAGARWHQVITATGAHGLAPLSGSSPGVGAVSYTLNGGLGLMARRFGYAADHVRSIEVVTPDGRLRRVAGDDDLFWALRGAGGNFGVVTGMDIELMPVARLYGGSLYFNARTEILAGWLEWTRDLPEEMTSGLSMLTLPDFESVPEPLRGRHIVQLQLAHTGEETDGERLVAPLRELGPSVLDTVGSLPFVESDQVFAEPAQPHPYRGRAVLLDDMDTASLPELVECTGPDGPVTVAGIRRLGGALSRPPAVANAIGHRGAGYSLGLLSVPGPDEQHAADEAQRRLLEHWRASTIAPLPCFTFAPLTPEELRAAYEPDDYRRLTELRARYDPRRRLAPHHEIPPE